MAQNEWQIGTVKFNSKADYEDGLKDLALIRLIKKEHDINNPETAKKLYGQLRFQEGLFKTDVGRRFFAELAASAARGEAEKASPLPVQYTEPVESNANVHENSESGDTSGITPHRKAWLLIAAIASILILICCIFRLVSYSIMGYNNIKDMNELRSMIGESRIEIEIDDTAADFAYTVINQEALKNNNTIADKYIDLYNLNNDLIGWVSVEDTQIDYPVMQNSDDSEYYLHRGFEHEENDEGLPFLDIRCAINPDSTNLLIYGHNMKNGHIFADLMKYESRDFFEKHRIIRFDTIYEEGFYDIIAVFRTHIAYVGEDTFRYYGLIDASDESEFNTYIENVKDLSIYETGVTASYGDKLLTLSTCEYTEQDGRFVIVAKKIS